MMATKQILEGARSFKAVQSAEHDGYAPERLHWRWPGWPSKLGLRTRDKYLIDIRPRRLPSA
jgi:hypothetical protein